MELPKETEATLNTLALILGDSTEARHALNAAYALGVIDAVLGKNAVMTSEQRLAA